MPGTFEYALSKMPASDISIHHFIYVPYSQPPISMGSRTLHPGWGPDNRIVNNQLRDFYKLKEISCGVAPDLRFIPFQVTESGEIRGLATAYKTEHAKHVAA
jgi:hypothetical protein